MDGEAAELTCAAGAFLGQGSGLRPLQLPISNFRVQSSTVTARKVRSDRRASFDDFVGACEDKLRNGDAGSFRGLQVYDQLETRRRLDWQITRLLPAQDTVRIPGGGTKLLELVLPKGDQSA